MDEMNQSQNRSTNEADTSRSSADENVSGHLVFIGEIFRGGTKCYSCSIERMAAKKKN